MKELIVVVDDEPDIVELVSVNLDKALFKVEKCSDAESFFRLLYKQTPDLIILDLMLPDADGFEICKYLKKEERFSSLPIIMLTAKGEETDKILGLEFGADDYITKPFSPKELVARVKSVLRRRQKPGESERLGIGELLKIDLESYQVFVEGKNVELTSTEFRIVKLLLSKKGKVFSRYDILDYLWGDDKIVLDRTIDVHIRNLREKLGRAGRLIKNIRGVGYKLEESS
ncbi:MAG: response regulator [Candidatus Scalindua sp.]|nr:response regulator [Candidatus Scalindua sp.]